MSLSTTSGPPVAGSEPSADRPLDAASIAERATYGLGTDAESLARLLEAGDVGSAQVGIPATAEELRQLDLTGRTEFAVAAHEGVLAYAESLKEYAGAFFDPSDNGNLTILLTSDDPQLRAEIERRAPPGPRIVTVARASVPYSELVRVTELIRSLTFESFPQSDIHFVGVDIQNNSVRVEVDETRIAELESLLQQEQRFGEVDVVVVGGGAGIDTACFRHDCTDPMKAGLKIRREDDTNATCTMGFHVSKDGNEVFLTAGHCGFGAEFDWYHPIDATQPIGNDGATWYVQNGVDVMRVSMPDAQASNLVFGMSNSVTGTFYPAEGETHCASLGVTGGPPDCGTITDAYGSWTSSTCNCGVFGSRASGIAVTIGDSGSPITLGSTAQFATGIQNVLFPNGTIGFARVKQAVEHWGLTIPCGFPC
jgi:hypothetical protein